MLTEIEMRMKLKDAMIDRGNLTSLARASGIDHASLSLAASGRRPVSDKVARAIGYRKAIVYFPA